MADFVLVPGAWLGAGAWEQVAAQLTAAGHRAHPITLSGLAERSAEPAGQQTHVQDVVAEIKRLDLRDVVLVGHSYSGVPVGQAAQRIGDRLAHVVFVDANVPVDGQSFLASWSEGRVEAQLAENDGYWPPLTPPDFEGQGLSDDQIDQIIDGSTRHPGATLTEPAVVSGALGDLPATYIKCLLDGDEPDDDVAALLLSPTWTLVELETGHWPMISSPERLTDLLLTAAGAPSTSAEAPPE